MVKEARVAFQLTHANICQVLDLGTGAQGVFMVLEYVRGVDLGRLLRRLQTDQRRLDLALALYIGREAARALDYAHRRTDAEGRPLSLVHGDVTPRNLLLSVEGEVKLSDFGICRTFFGTAPGNRVYGGTPGYMAPETRSASVDHRADIYSLGVTLYAALSGREPVSDGIDFATLDAGSRLLTILKRATAERPGDRQLSAGELEQELSAELGRCAPGFTPSALAGLVRAYTPSAGAGPEHVTEVVVLSSDLAGAPAAPLHDGPSPPRGGPRRSPLFARVTATLQWAPDRRMQKGLVVLGAALVLAVGTGVVVTLHRSSRVASPMQAASAAPTFAPPARVEDPAHAARATLAPTTQQVAYLTVYARPAGRLLIDDRMAAKRTPVYRFAVPAGTHRIAVAARQGKPRVRTVSLQSGEVQVVRFVP
jgi:hypothetical protein